MDMDMLGHGHGPGHNTHGHGPYNMATSLCHDLDEVLRLLASRIVGRRVCRGRGVISPGWWVPMWTSLSMPAVVLRIADVQLLRTDRNSFAKALPLRASLEELAAPGATSLSVVSITC